MQRKGMNNRQLAAALGVGDSYASGISRGDKNLSMNTLQQAQKCPYCGHDLSIKVE